MVSVGREGLVGVWGEAEVFVGMCWCRGRDVVAVGVRLI